MPRGVDSLDRATFQGRIWTPATINNRLVWWFDAKNLASQTQDSSNLISNIVDRSNKGRNVSITGSSRPTYTSRGPLSSSRSIPTFTCAGSQTMNFANFTETLSYFGIFAAVKSTTGNTTKARLFDGGTSRASCEFGATDINAAGAVGMYIHTGAGWLTCASNYHQSQNIICTLGWCTAASNKSYTIQNGSKSGLHSGSAAISNMASSSNNMKLFTNNAANAAFFSGDVSEMFCVSGEISDYDSQLFSGYLAWANGIESQLIASNPFKNRPPMIGD